MKSDELKAHVDKIVEFCDNDDVEGFIAYGVERGAKELAAEPEKLLAFHKVRAEMKNVDPAKRLASMTWLRSNGVKRYGA